MTKKYLKELINGDYPALMVARSENQAKLLIEAGADVNAKDMRGQSVLRWAIGCKKLGIAKLLIEAGAKN